jgi:hypothetical protein
MVSLGRIDDCYRVNSCLRPDIHALAIHLFMSFKHTDEDMLLMHICAYTVEIQSFDALTLVFVKEGRFVRNNMENKIQETAREILGDKFGTLLHVRGDCALE